MPHPHSPIRNVRQGCFGPEIKTGREDRTAALKYEGLHHRHKFCHGMDPATYHQQTAWATVNQLTMQTPVHGKSKVHTNLFMGNHLHDKNVPHNVSHNPRVEARKQRLAAEAAESPYATTHNTMYGDAAIAIAAVYATGTICRPPLAMPSAEGGQLAMVGRKAVGPCAGEFDKSYNKLGLRAQ